MKLAGATTLSDPDVMATAIVLCAGFGTRLRPLTLELPKPLVPVGDGPLIQHAITALNTVGVVDVVLNTHHLADKFANYISQLPGNIQLIHEPEIRGTGGALRGARHALAPPVVVWNGDILADPDLLALLAVASPMALAVASRPLGEGTVGVGSDGQVVRLRGERFGTEVRGGDYLGIAALAAEAVERAPDSGCLIGDICLPMLRQGQTIPTVASDVPWSDLGTPDAYLEANLRWLGEQANWIDPTAQVDSGVELKRSLVGRGATATGTGELEECVVWPGATVRAPLRRAIVTPERVVQLK